MEHRLRLRRVERKVDVLRVCQVATDELGLLRYRCPVSLQKIVEHKDIVSRLDQQLCHRAANVARPAHN
jgi:hypothetical protein